jgi:glc operon protein GlcG
MKTIFLSIVAALFMATLASAQVEASYELTLSGAQQIIEKAAEYARANKAPGGAIAVTDDAGTLIALVRLDGSFPKAAEVAHGKARTAALFRFASKKLEDSVLSGRNSLLSVGEVVLKGGLPIVYKGKTIGAIGVSGAASADQDVLIAEAGLTAEFLK